MLTDRLQNLETLLREMREENDRKISELKNELAGERAAKEKEVASLTVRLSQAEESLSHQKEETSKIWEAVSQASCQSPTSVIPQDDAEARVSREEVESLVSASVAQAVKTLVQPKEETKDWEMQLKREQEEQEEERKRKEKAEAHLFTVIKVSRDKDLWEQIGSDQIFDLVDHEHVTSFRLPNQMCFADFQREVEREVGVPVAGQRFWLWGRRQNHTYRPKRPLNVEEERMTVRQLRDSVSRAHRTDLRLFLEGSPTPPNRPVAPLHERAKDDILLFLKFYNPLTETLRYVGRLFVKLGQTPADVRGKINEMCGLSFTDDILLFEEIKFEPSVMCEAMDCTVTFRGGQLEDGDIICVQRAKPLAREGAAAGAAGSGGSTVRYPDVPSFLEYVRNRQVVHFRRLEKPTEDSFCLELSKENMYDDVVARLAEEIGLDNPSKVRLTTHNCYSQKPKPPAIKYRGVDCLADMLVHYDQSTDILYFETLDIPLPELQQLKTLNITFHNSKAEEVSVHNIRMPKKSTVADVLADLKTKVELSHPKAELRLLQVFYNKIYKIFPLTEQIEYINDQYWGIRAEEVFNDGSTFHPSVLEMSEDDLLGHFASGVANVAAISLGADYPTLAAVPHVFANSYKNVIAVALALDDNTFPLADKVKEILADPSKFMVAAVAAAPAAAAESAKEEAKPAEEEKEESDDDMGFSLFD
ncbi:unnamed protein product [Closterium sp. Naga37s-1]|nr:unnamed protein product [Closterium sp. Naga37s-1]